MFKKLHRLPQIRLYELYKWKTNNIEYVKQKTEKKGLIEYIKPIIHKSIIVSRTKKNELLNLSMISSSYLPLKKIIENKIHTENLLYEKYGLYSCFLICIISGSSYVYIIYNELELLFLL